MGNQTNQTQNTNPNPPVSPVEQTPQNPTVEKPKPKFSIGAIIGIILFLLVAGGAAASFTVFRPQITKLFSKSTLTPTIVQTPTPTLDPTANWKTFDSPEGGFSFKYPNDYKLFDNSIPGPDGVSASAKQTVSILSPNIVSLNTNFILSIYFDTSKNFTTAQQIATALSINKQGIESNLGGVKGYLFEDVPLGPYGSSILYFENGSKSYTVTIQSNQPYSKISSYANQILSTFKFTN